MLGLRLCRGTSPPCRADITNLHSIWDAAGGLYQENAPYTTGQMAELMKNATSITAEWPESKLADYSAAEFGDCWSADDTRLQMTQQTRSGRPEEAYGEPCAELFKKWAGESYGLAINASYAHAEVRPSDSAFDPCVSAFDPFDSAFDP